MSNFRTSTKFFFGGVAAFLASFVLPGLLGALALVASLYLTGLGAGFYYGCDK